jgi:hypothetical protein
MAFRAREVDMKEGVLMLRPPDLPQRESIPEEERDDYDFVVERIRKLGSGRTVDRNPYVRAVLNSPPFAASLWVFSGRMLAAGERDNSYTHKDREHINVVLAFDAGHYEMTLFHLEYAVTREGLRYEMVKALWEGRDDDLLPDERQLVDYIRTYVNGTVTDEMWSGIVERFGLRGAVEYTLAIGYHLMVIRGMQAFGTPAGTREEMQERLERLGSGDAENEPHVDWDARKQVLRGVLNDPMYG